MEHNHPEMSAKVVAMDHSKMDHSNMQDEANPSMGMEGHNHHAMMIADFKKRFYVVSSVVFFYGGWPFLKGLVDEVKAKNPGMMFLRPALSLRCHLQVWYESFYYG